MAAVLRLTGIAAAEFVSVANSFAMIATLREKRCGWQRASFDLSILVLHHV